ncbi:MAG: oligoendopeptidase F, partial [Chloroflexia bacterium]
MVTTTSTLPRWDMTPIFPGLDSPEYKQGFQSIIAGIDNLTALFDHYNISRHDPAPLDDATVAQFE